MSPSQSGKSIPKRPSKTQIQIVDVEKPGRLRVSNIMGLFGYSHSTVYARMKQGTLPPFDGKDGRISYWLTSSIRPLLSK